MPTFVRVMLIATVCMSSAGLAAQQEVDGEAPNGGDTSINPRLAVTSAGVSSSPSEPSSAKELADRRTARNDVRSPQEIEVSEVIVSAQKREERIQDVPISISVLRGEDLDRSSFVGIMDTLNS